MPSPGSRHKLSVLKHEVKTLKKASEECAKAAIAAKKNQLGNKRDIGELERMIKDTDAELNKKKEELVEMESKLGELASQLKKLQASRKQLEGDIRKEEGVRLEIEKKMSDIKAAIKTLKATIAEKEQERELVKGKIEKLNAPLIAATAALEAAKKELLAAEATVIAVKSEETKLRNLIETVEQHVQSVSQDSYNATAQLAATNESLKVHDAKQKTHAKECALQKASVRSANEKVCAAKVKKSVAHSNHDDLTKKVNDAEQVMNHLASIGHILKAQAADSQAMHSHQTQVAATQDANAQSAKSAVDAKERNVSRVKESVNRATSVSKDAVSTLKETRKSLEARIDQVRKAAQQTSEATKKFEKSQADLNSRLKEQTEKRKDKETKEELVKRQEEEKRRLESLMSGIKKILKSVLSALTRVTSLLAFSNPQLMIAAGALHAINALVSMCEQNVADSNQMLEKAVHEQDERIREHDIALTDQERAQHDSLLKEVALLNEASRLTEAVAMHSLADSVAREQMSFADRERALEKQMKGLSAQLEDESKQADATLASHNYEYQKKARERDQACKERDEAAVAHAEAVQQLTAAEDSLKVEEKKVQDLLAQQHELSASRACLDEKLKLINGTKDAAKMRLVDLKQQCNTKHDQLEECRKKESARKDDVSTHREAVHKLNADLVLEQNRLDALGVEIKRACNNEAVNDSELVAAKRERDMAEGRLHSLQKELQTCEAEIDVLDDDSKKCSVNKGKLESSIRAGEQEQSVQHRKHGELKEKSKGLQETLDTCSASAKTAQQSFRAKESDVEALEASHAANETNAQQTTTPQAQRIQY